ncbi:MAG: hypothetical protein LBU89_01975 [Fibromonadaceae bacterium]|jgi:hypothetical protein|nr:hypothetical protein [Fibromonadaceae bacterium]
MTTATVEIKNNIALDLLQYLENIGMLRLLKKLPATAELPKAGLAKARGGLRKYANPNLIPFEKEVWEKTAVRKYAKQ